MAPPSWTQQIDNMFTTTWSYRREDAVEQAYMKNPFIFWLREKAKKSVAGHTRLEIPVEYGKNETVRWIKKGSSVPLTEGELFTMVFDVWRTVSVTIMRFGEEDRQNRGKARIIPYVDRKINAAERALWEELERVMFADGTGDDEPNGLQNLIATDPTTGTLHGANRATYSWWRNLTKTASGAFSVYGLSDIRNCLNTMTKYAKSEISDIFMYTDQTTYEAFDDEMLDMKMFYNQTLVDAGFPHLSYRERPLLWAPSAPSARIYFINPNYYELVTDEEFFMDMTEWKPIPDQVRDRTAQITCTLQACTTRPISQMVLHTITY